jgi:hypothetical protein
VKDAEEVIVVSGNYAELLVWHNVCANPDEDTVFGDPRRHDATVKTAEGLPKSRTRTSVEPPVLANYTFATYIPERLHVFAHVLER